MDVILFFGLAINLFVQLFRKGEMHVNLYKELNLVDDNESYAKTFFTGTFFKYPIVVIPFVEKFKDLNGNAKALYEKLKRQNYFLWFSILSIVGFFLYVFTFYE